MCPETRLQLSEDTQFLMEVQGNLVAAIYKRIELDTVDEHGFVIDEDGGFRRADAD